MASTLLPRLPNLKDGQAFVDMDQEDRTKTFYSSIEGESTEPTRTATTRAILMLRGLSKGGEALSQIFHADD